MINIAICDDDDCIIKEITTYLNTISEDLNLDLLIEPYHSGDKLIQSIKDGEIYDIIFMDIEMKGRNGIETAKYFRKLKLNLILIFISNYEKYLIELFDVEPFRFIKKPINNTKFREIFIKALNKIMTQCDFFEYCVKKQSKKIYFKDIIYFESAQRQIILHKKDGTDIFYYKLNEIEENLSKKSIQFIRIHQSFLVNYSFIKTFKPKHIEMFNGDILNISEDRQKRAKKHYFSLLDSDYFK